MPGFGDFLAAIAQRLGQQAQATQQGTLGLGPDPNAPPAPFGHPLSIHYGALPGFLGVPLRAAITPLQMAGLVAEAGQGVGRLGTGTVGAGLGALQNALNSPYGGAVTALAHTAPVVGSVADALNMAPHLGPLNFMQAGPLKTADAQRALSAFMADPGIQGELAANEALAQGNKYATGAANTFLNPLNYAGMTGELGAALRAGPAIDALGGSGKASLAAQGAGRALQGLARTIDLANAPGAAAFSGLAQGLRRGPVAGLTAAGEHLGLSGMVPRFLPGLDDLAAALGRPGAAVPGAPPTAVPLPSGPPLAPGLEDLQRALGGAPPAGLAPAGGGGIAPGYVPPVPLPTGRLPRIAPAVEAAGAMFGAAPPARPVPTPAPVVPPALPAAFGRPLAAPSDPAALAGVAQGLGVVPRPSQAPNVIGDLTNAARGLAPLPDPTESLQQLLAGTAPAAAAPALPAGPLEAFLGDTAATYRTPTVPSPTGALDASAALPEAAAPAATAATNWADRAGVIRQVANAPLAHLNSVLADLHNALYPGRQADFAIPSLTGQPKAAFRTSMLTDAAGQNRAEPYLDYLLNRVQKDPAAATRLADINPTLADEATRLAQTDLAPDAHKAVIQALFKGPPGTLDDFNALLAGKWSTSMYLPPEGAFAKELGVPIAQARRWIDDAIAGGTLARDATGQLTFAPRGPGAAAPKVPPVPAVPAPPAAGPPPLHTLTFEDRLRAVLQAHDQTPEELARSAQMAATHAEQVRRFGPLVDAGDRQALGYIPGSRTASTPYQRLYPEQFYASRISGVYGDAAANIYDAQRRVVEAALNEGKAVPAQVLADFPMLADRAAQAARPAAGDIAAGGGGGLGGGGLGLLPPRLPQTLGGAVAGGVVGAGVGAAADEDNRLRGALKGAGLGVLAGGGLGSGIPDAYAAPLAAIAKEGYAATRESLATGQKNLFPGGQMMGYIRSLRKTGMFVVPRNALGAMGNIVMGGGDLPQALRYAGEMWQNIPTLLPALRAAGSDEAAKAAAMYQALPADMQQYGEQGIARLMEHSGSAYERNAADLGAANVHPFTGALRGGIMATASPRTLVMGLPSLALGAFEGLTLAARAAMQNAWATWIDVSARVALSFPAYTAGLEAEAPGFIAKVAKVDPTLASSLDSVGRFDPSDIVSSAAPGARATPGLDALAAEWLHIQDSVAETAGTIATDRMGNFTSPKGVSPGGILNTLFPGGVWNVQQAAVLARAASEHPALALAALNAMRQDYEAHVQRGDPQHAGTWELTDKTPGFGALVRLANGGPGSFYVNPAYPFSPFSGETLNLPRELDPRLNPNQTLYDRAMKVGSALGLAVNPEVQAVAYKEGASATPMTNPLRLAPVGQWADAKLGLGLTANPLAQGLDPQGSVANMEDINLQLRRGQYLDPAIARSGAEIIYEQTGRPASDPSNAPLLAQLRDHSTPLYQQAEARGLGGKAALAGINEALPVSGQAEGQTAGDVARAQMQLFARGIPFTKAQITALAGGDMTTASMAVQAALDRAKLANPLLAVNDAASPQAQAQALASDFIRQNRGLQGLWPELFNVAYQAQQERLGLVPAGTLAGLQQQMDWRNAGLQPGGYMIGPGMPMPDYGNPSEGVRQLMRDRMQAGR